MLADVRRQLFDAPVVIGGEAVVGDEDVPDHAGHQGHVHVLAQFAFAHAALQHLGHRLDQGPNEGARALVGVFRLEPGARHHGLHQRQVVERAMIAGGQAARQAVQHPALGRGAADVGQQAFHLFGEDGLEQLGLVLEVGEDGTGGHARALGYVADGGRVIAALGEERAGRVQDLLAGAHLGGLATVQPRLGLGFDGFRGGQGRLTHRRRL
ncbi:hypothetical protein D3C80_1101530 [compost metagenome]